MNNVYYFEIQATDPDNLQQFYATVFGWKFITQEGMPVDYWQIEGAGIPGGLLRRPTPVLSAKQGTNAFTCSVQVDNFDRVANLILRQGGQIALPKFAVPGRCWQGYFIDVDGNTFGIFEADENAAI